MSTRSTALIAAGAMLLAPAVLSAQELVLNVDSLRTVQILENRRNNGNMSAIALGDIDGDGFDDIVIGAPRAPNVATIDTGVVYVRWGGNYFERFPPSQDRGSMIYDFTAPPDIVANPINSAVVLPDRGNRDPSGIQINAERPGEAFGWSVAVGDFNGDNYADIAIGSPAPFAPDRFGRVYILFGRADLGGVIDIDLAINDGDAVEIRGRTEGDRFGSTLLFADLNNDGYDDLIIGTPLGGPGGTVDIIYGGPDPITPARTNISGLSIPTTRILTGVAGERLGTSLAAANLTPGADSYKELLIGAPRWPNPSQSRGRVIAIKFDGSQPFQVDLDVTQPYFSIVGENNTMGIGQSLAVGDFFGDTLPDLVIGAPLESHAGLTNAGTVHIVNDPARFAGGSATVPTSAQTRIRGEQANENFGAAVAIGPYDLAIGDDLIVGAPGRTIGPATSAGAVYIYRTNTLPSGDVNREADGLPITRMQAIRNNLRFGSSLAMGKFYGLNNQDIFIATDGTYAFNPACGSSDPNQWELCSQSRQGLRVVGVLSGTVPQPPGGLSARQGWLELE